MVLPSVIVIFTPLFFGIFFGPLLVIGILLGSLYSGILLAISMCNSGGAWDNAKKFIESGQFFDENGI